MASLKTILKDIYKLLVFRLLFAKPFDQLLLKHHLFHIIVKQAGVLQKTWLDC
jgi:hypothetical protein